MNPSGMPPPRGAQRATAGALGGLGGLATEPLDGWAWTRAKLVSAGHRLVTAAALTGAIAPSSRYLANAMARAAQRAGALVELGAGRGPVTRALVRAHPGLRLIVVELQPGLAAMLRRKFKTAEVHAEPAAGVLRKLSGLPAATALVSSLPFRSLPKALKQETVDSVLDFLRAGDGRFMLQYTYGPGVPFRVPPGFRWRKQGFVALNVPPAAIWILEPEAEPKLGDLRSA